jgi:Ni/Co efflux regulator RcnB
MPQWSKAAAIAALILITAPVTADVQIDVSFGKHEISIIRDYYDSLQREARKEKHAGRSSLPPGIAKNLERGKALPPGIARQSLPADLIGKLPAPPAGHERVIVDGKVLLVEVATQVIRDVLTDLID